MRQALHFLPRYHAVVAVELGVLAALAAYAAPVAAMSVWVQLAADLG